MSSSPDSPSSTELKEARLWMAFRKREAKKNPRGPVPTYEEFQVYQELVRLKRAADASDASTPVPSRAVHGASTQPAPNIDPTLLVGEERVAEIVAKHVAKHMARRVESDDEDSATELLPSSGKRKRLLTKPRLLTRQGRVLKPKEATLRNDLKALVKSAMQELTGMPNMPFPRNGEPEEAPPAPIPGRTYLPVGWGEHVNSTKNVVVIQQAALLVWKQEEDEITRKIPIASRVAKWTLGDLEELGKGTYRYWHTRWRAYTFEDVAARMDSHKDENRRLGRQKMAVQRRGAELVREEFCDRNPQYVDIFEQVVQTPYMSFELSDRSELSDAAREQRTQVLRERAGLTQQEMDRKVKVLEKVSITWRSRALNNIYRELDKIAYSLHRNSAPSHKRVDLGNTADEPPSRSVYNFMVSKRWKAAHEGIEYDVHPVGELEEHILEGLTPHDMSPDE